MYNSKNFQVLRRGRQTDKEPSGDEEDPVPGDPAGVEHGKDKPARAGPPAGSGRRSARAATVYLSSILRRTAAEEKIRKDRKVRRVSAEASRPDQPRHSDRGIPARESACDDGPAGQFALH